MDNELTSAGQSERVIKSVRLLRTAALSILAVVVIAANVVLFRQIDLQLERSYTAETDNKVWGVAQIEVEVLQFQNALRSAIMSENSPAALTEVRLKFDILYSRLEIIGNQYKAIKLPLLQSATWSELTGPTGLIETSLPFMDGPDDKLAASIPDLLLATESVKVGLRKQVVETLQTSILTSEMQREELRSSLQLFSAVALALMGVMAGLMVVIGLQGRARERHRQELSQAVFNLRTTIDSSLEAAVILDHDGRIIGCNRAGADMFNWQEGAGQTRHFADLIQNLRRGAEGIRQVALACSSGNANGRTTMKGRKPDGTLFPLEISLAQAQSATGMPIAIAFLRDISEMVERERALEAARNLALQGEQAKSRFLAMISHEMRTPLNGLLSAVELLNNGTKLDPNQAWLLRIIENCGKTTLEQVNNVLDLTSLKSLDEKNLPNVDFNVVSVINAVADQFAVEAKARGNSIVIRVTGDAPKALTGKQALIQRIVTNLVSNAVKFTEDGTIVISADFQPARSEGQVSLRLAVSDTGVGIADSDLDRIFKTFETLDTSYSRLQQGSGLGLGLAKLSAEAMGGRMTVSSRKNEGSTFALYLTMNVASAGYLSAELEAEENTSLQIPKLRLLVVEDNPVNRELLVEILKQRGHDVYEARNGLEGVNETLRHRPDVVLMDISMPVMDGLEAAKEIRSYPALPRIPIIAVTANSDSVSAGEFAQAGIDNVLSKPLDLKQLDVLLRRYVEKIKDSPRESVEAIAQQPSAEGRLEEDIAITNPVEAIASPEPAELNKIEIDGESAEAVKANVSSRPLLDEEIFSDLSAALGETYMQKMTSRFVQEAESAIAEIQVRQEAGDFKSAAAIAHKNAGAAASLGLKAMHEVLVTYEREAKAGNTEAAVEMRERIETIKLETFDLLRDRGLTA